MNGIGVYLGIFPNLIVFRHSRDRVIWIGRAVSTLYQYQQRCETAHDDVGFICYFSTVAQK